MQKGNVVIIYHHKENKVLMCKRVKEPYMGKYNMVGGKVEDNETEIEAAYREMYEESGITKDDISLIPVLNIFLHMDQFELQVFAGKLNKEVVLKEEKNPLYWISLDRDFGSDEFAGEGNIQYFLNYIDLYLPQIRR